MTRNFPDRRVLPLLLGLMIAVVACSEGAGAPDAAAVNVYEVKRGDFKIAVSEKAEIQAAEQVTISSRIEGRATLIYLAPEGTIVEEGDKLAEFDVSNIEENYSKQAISVAKAKAAVEQARKSVEVMEAELKSDRTAAESRLRIAEMELEKFLGGAGGNGESAEGTNREMLAKLGELLASDPRAASHAGLEESLLELMATDEILDRNLGQLGNDILSKLDEIRLARAQLEIHRDTYGHSENLANKGFITRNELERDHLNYESQLSKVNLSWNNLDLLINYTLRQTQIRLTQDVQNADLDLVKTLGDNDSRRLREQVDLLSKEAEFQLASERLANGEKQINNAIIYAPSPGLVVYAQQGSSRWSRQPIEEGMDIRERQAIVQLPNLTSMVAELSIQEAEIEYVQERQRALVQIDAFPEHVFEASVERVASLPDSGSSWSGSDRKMFKTRIALEEYEGEIQLRPGMSASVEIIVDIVEDVLSVPLPGVQRSGSDHYVWKWSEFGPVAEQIKIGRNNLTHVHILAGLQEGDLIFLSPPEGIDPPEFSAELSAAGSEVVLLDPSELFGLR